MKKRSRVLGISLVAVMLVFAFVISDWYRFATSGKISPTEGVFFDHHLEVWIDVNARMPTPMRLWACKVLMARQTKVMGREGAVPHSCQPDFGKPSGPMADALIGNYVARAVTIAQRSGATAEQQKIVSDCMQTALDAAVTPEMRDALNGSLTQKTILALDAAARAPMQSCLAAIGK